MRYEVKNLTVELEPGYAFTDEKKPRFGWRIESDGRDVLQTGYRLTVKKGAETVWDSGKVEGGESQWIEYAGAPLLPRTRYDWAVESFSEGGAGSAVAAFETGLMDETYAAWRGARWIGADEVGLAARVKAIFSIQLDFFLRGEATGVIFGKNDPRLLDGNKNDYGLAGENYIKYRLTRAGALEIYRVGYHPSDRADVPFATVEIPGFDPALPHALRVDVTGNNAYAYLDGVRVDEVKKELTRRMPGMPPFLMAPRQLNPAGKNDVTTYPLLCESGFFAEGECEVVRFSISNLRPPKAQLVRVEAATPGPFGESVKVDRLVIRDAECTHDFSYGAIPLLRRAFNLEGTVKRARLYATARGVYEAEINGSRVGDRWFEPGAAQYDRHLRYQVSDVTSLLRAGENRLDVALASGWWSEAQTFTLMNCNYWGDRPSFLSMLVIEKEDGTEETVVSAPGAWSARTDGPVKFAGFFYGEHYDARKAAPNWKKAVEIPSVDFSELLAEGGFMRWPVPTTNPPALAVSTGSPVRHVLTLTAQAMSEPRPGVYVYDMGQNMVGVPEIVLSGEPGQEAVIRYGEVLYPPLAQYGDLAGMILTENYRDALSIDRYAFASDEPETFSPRFTFHGYRYVEVTGVKAPPRPEDVKGLVLSSIERRTGEFECSNPLVNRLYENILWSQRANFLSIPTDCPQRNERMGWAGDAQVFSRTAIYNADVYGFLRRYLECVRDCQLPDGRFADIAPVGGGFGGIEWGSAGVIVTYELYKQYGDPRVIEENFDAMARYVEFLRGKGTPGQLDNVGPLGDWLATDMSTDNPLLWNAIYYFDATIMAEMARVVGRDDEAYEALAAEIRENWNRTFVDPETKKTRRMTGEINDTQASYAVPLAFGLFDDAKAASNRLAEKSKELGYAVTTGFVGTGPLLPALTDGGHAETAYRILQNTAYPSWLYSITEGATTIWERWNSVTRENGFGGNNRMNSFNHYSLGAVGAWMYMYALGIRRGESWRMFRLEPSVGAMDFAKGKFESLYGTIEAGWTREGGKVTYKIVVPANTRAEVLLPTGTKYVGNGAHEFTW